MAKIIDVRDVIIDKLEAYCKEHDIRCIWAIERSVDGALVFNFKQRSTDRGLSRRVTRLEMNSIQGDVVTIIVEDICKQINREFDLEVE